MLVIALHIPATALGWYWEYRWLDIPMHLAGGFAVAWCTMVLWRKYIERVVVRPRASVRWRAVVPIVALLGCTAVVGIAWEIFEWGMDTLFPAFVQMFGTSQVSSTDMLFDLANDLFGATIAVILLRAWKG